MFEGALISSADYFYRWLTKICTGIKHARISKHSVSETVIALRYSTFILRVSELPIFHLLNCDIDQSDKKDYSKN